MSCSTQSNVGPRTLTDLERDGLVGNVKAVLTEDVVLMQQEGQWVENQQASSVATYDAAGKRISQAPFRVSLAGGYALTQHELMFDPLQKNRQVEEKQTAPDATKAGVWLKAYDAKGNLVERALLNASRVAVSKESVSYEYDDRGNWVKRAVTKSLAQTGQTPPEFSESSYRHIVYFDSVGKSKDTVYSPDDLTPVMAKEMKSPIQTTQENTDAGRGLYLQKCAACHSENGKAQTDFAAAMPTKPADLTSAEVRALTEGQIYSRISRGIKTTGMPAFKGRISDNNIWQIAMFVRTLSAADAKPAMAAKTAPTPQATHAAEAERRYTLNGKVVSVERESKQVMIEHEEVKGYMEAMTMPFPMTDEKMLDRLKRGDKIQATLIVGIGFWRLENVVIK